MDGLSMRTSAEKVALTEANQKILINKKNCLMNESLIKYLFFQLINILYVMVLNQMNIQNRSSSI